jgi:tetratricopeptide (TPR) repeat protein
MKRVSVVVWALGFCVLIAGIAAATPIEIAQEAFDLRLAGKVDEAVGLLEEGVVADSTQAILFYELSRAKLFLMDFEGMQEAIEKAVALEPANADYHYFAGLASSFSLINAAHHDQQDQMKHFGDKTISELEAAVRCNPDHLEARCTLVQRITALAEDMGWDTKAAEEHARILEAKDPIQGAKARSYLAAEGQGADLWEKVIRDHPDQWRAWYEAGDGFLDAGNPDRASECLDKALEMNPQRFYPLLRLATVFAMERDWDRAEAIIRRYISLDPPLPLLAFAWGQLGQIEKQRGNVAAGEELISKAMEMDPHLWRTFMPPTEEIFTRP